MSLNASQFTRHLTLARALHARLYINPEGRVYAASGRVSYSRLVHCLAHFDGPPSMINAPSPHDLGVDCCDGELSQHLLQCMSRSLTRWRKALDCEARRRPAQRRKLAELKAERSELERLSVRLAAVCHWRTELVCGREPFGTPYFLDPLSENDLAAILCTACHGHALTPLMAWYARVVYWLSGNSAARRFVAASAGLVGGELHDSRRAQLSAFRQVVQVMKLRCKQERMRDLLGELAQRIRRLHPEVLREGQFSARLRGRSFLDHCDHLLSTTDKWLAEDHFRRWQAIPAELAGVSATDASSVALPECFAQRLSGRLSGQCSTRAVLGTIRALASQIGKPGYDTLLLAINELPVDHDAYVYNSIRLLATRGDSVPDVLWSYNHGLVDAFESSGLNARETRRLNDAFASRGCVLPDRELFRLVVNVRRAEDVAPIEAWLTWLGSVSPRTITPRLQNSIMAFFWKCYLPGVQQLGWFEHFEPCLSGPSRIRDSANIAPILERIASYQRLLGKSQRLPKSIRKLLELEDRRRQEFEHLQKREGCGELDAAARHRLQFLKRSPQAPLMTAKLRRVAEEICLLLGIEAQSAVARRLAEVQCREHLSDLVDALDRSRMFDFSLWIGKMSDEERIRLARLIDARQRFGPEYKRHLPENRDWISKAAARGINLGGWFAAEPRMCSIDGRSHEIALVSQLDRIFLMGDYFKTCLSIGNINEFSVLANACDANKQVIFMFALDESGGREVVGRQLVAISQDFKLLGYCCYLNWRHVEKAKRQKAQDAMASYCAWLAANCGLELADQGTPEEIEGSAWYDDGERAWPTIARTDWAKIAL